MSEEEISFSTGDWVSHLHHGVGQIEGIEKKSLGGESQEYFKVLTRNGVFWIPTDKINEDRIRLVVSEKVLKKSIAILESPPEKMDSKHTVRKKRINQVIKQGDLKGFCTLLRDLHGKRVADKLNTTEQRAYTKIKKKIAAEWAATREISVQDANKELNKILRKIKKSNKLKKKK
jgi:RNA polymerase-interacting CarD/CdnL/TRCF family regulator